MTDRIGKPRRSAGLKRGARPRKPGLLKEINWRRESPAPDTYAYAMGDRIGPDLTVIGHLAVGRLNELYQVWSASEWCLFTLKILSAASAESRTARAALRREHRILRKLRHPNVVRVFGGGEHEGALYLVLEYLEGPSLLDALETLPARRMNIPDALRAVIHAGSGVVHLHRKGFLHLDIKPANFLLRENVPVLLDLDTARPVNPARTPRSAPGTAPYMSPEQALRKHLGPPADIYGLGATLYELITGRWPFEDVYEGNEHRNGEELQYPQIGYFSPPSPRSLRADVSPSLDRTVMSALAREPENRFTEIAEFLLALSAELKDSVSLWPKRAHPESGKTGRRS